jgi:uncharacterized membrane protein YebE (DUF533 family)
MEGHMKKSLLTILSAILLFSVTSIASAQDGNPANNTPGINQRQHNQQKRTKQGVKSGELTRREARKVKAEQAAIQAEKRVAKADGVVTKRERRAIQRDQNKASKDIYRQKHDGQDRN